MKLKESTFRYMHFRPALCLIYGFLVSGVAGVKQDLPPQISSSNGATRQTDLVELILLDPTLRLDVRYATANNLVGRPVYSEARAFLPRPAAEALVRVHRSLK